MNFDISIVIPAKDEEERLPQFLKTVIAHCNESAYKYEVIVVDDGSSDGTSAVAREFCKNFPGLQIIRLEQNRGKGHAVRCGILSARGKIRLFLDADGSTPVSEIEKNLHYFNEGFDIVIGSRVIEGNERSVKARSYRKLMGFIFNALVHTFLIKGIKDTQCGFKMFRDSIVGPLWTKVHLDGFGFDLEVLFLAEQMGYNVKEVPVNWTHVDGSKIRLGKDSMQMLGNIFQIRRWHTRIKRPTHQL
jgi:dolichyl-phosphate beta-glucosyltransferase